MLTFSGLEVDHFLIERNVFNLSNCEVKTLAPDVGFGDGLPRKFISFPSTIPNSLKVFVRFAFFVDWWPGPSLSFKSFWITNPFWSFSELDCPDTGSLL